MKEHPIIFKPEMVRAIQEGRKTQSRRTAKLKKINENPDEWKFYDNAGDFKNGGYKRDTYIFHNLKNRHPDYWAYVKCPYGVPGDQLWVRETFRPMDGFVQFKADLHSDWNGAFKWKPSIHMPRKASRIQLEVVSVRVERVKKISKKDAFAEGVVQINKSFLMDPEVLKIPVEYSNVTKLNDETYWGNDNPRGAFFTYLDEINGPEVVEQNQWVWAVEFKVVK